MTCLRLHSKLVAEPGTASKHPDSICALAAQRPFRTYLPFETERSPKDDSSLHACTECPAGGKVGVERSYSYLGNKGHIYSMEWLPCATLFAM